MGDGDGTEMLQAGGPRSYSDGTATECRGYSTTATGSVALQYEKAIRAWPFDSAQNRQARPQF
jgi:hypothetical protein